MNKLRMLIESRVQRLDKMGLTNLIFICFLGISVFASLGVFVLFRITPNVIDSSFRLPLWGLAGCIKTFSIAFFFLWLKQTAEKQLN